MKSASSVVAGDRVAAISLWEPWATLMAIRAKKNETRSWSTSHHGALLICAAARKHQGELRNLMHLDAFYDALHDQPLSHGHAVALVDLERCASTNHYWPDQDEHPFGDYSPGRFAWITTGLRRLKPFPVKGKQGIFYVTMPEFEELP